MKYVFKPYNPIYPDLFEKEKKRIGLPIQIEHIGSTGVPGLGGKGIIDIGVAVPKEEMDGVSKELQKLGYEFRPSFSTADRYYFILNRSDSEQRYHLHLTYPENREWKEFIGFRDYLRDHPEMAREYAELKKMAASEANQDGKRYRKLKEPIFDKIRRGLDD